MLLMGIDPGFASMGFALVELDGGIYGSTPISVVSMGVIRTEKSDKKQNVLASNDNFRRARELSRELRKIPRPDVICAESMSYPRNSSAAAKVSMAWGIIADYCEASGTPMLMATPKELKRAVCGNAGASKEEVQAALKTRYGSTLEDLLHKAGIPAGQWEHPFDALAAVTACLESETLRLLRRSSSARNQ